jgi:hypothetical protein
VLVRAHVTFHVEHFALEFKNRSVSFHGLFGLPWPPLSPKAHFGRSVQAHLTLQTPEPLAVQIPAVISRERTFRSDWMGLSFLASTNVAQASGERMRTILQRAIEQYGFYPHHYVRKTPRIPASDKIQTFPLKALAIPKEDVAGRAASPIVFDVRNISLGGVLLSTENPNALPLQLDQVLNLYFEPRGSFTHQIHVQAQVCRTIDEVIPGSGNAIRFLGLRFVHLDAVNKAAYLELVRDVVQRIALTEPAGEKR